MKWEARPGNCRENQLETASKDEEAAEMRLDRAAIGVTWVGHGFYVLWKSSDEDDARGLNLPFKSGHEGRNCPFYLIQAVGFNVDATSFRRRPVHNLY